jgi:hypothetical protein
VVAIRPNPEARFVAATASSRMLNIRDPRIPGRCQARPAKVMLMPAEKKRMAAYRCTEAAFSLKNAVGKLENWERLFSAPSRPTLK